MTPSGVEPATYRAGIAVSQSTAPVSFSMYYVNKNANAVLSDAAHSLQQGVLYFHNDIRFLSTQVNVIDNPQHWLRKFDDRIL